jgi:hypothetical protein
VIDHDKLCSTKAEVDGTSFAMASLAPECARMPTFHSTLSEAFSTRNNGDCEATGSTHCQYLPVGQLLLSVARFLVSALRKSSLTQKLHELRFLEVLRVSACPLPGTTINFIVPTKAV